MMKRLFLITFCLCFVMQTIHAEIVKPVFKQLKDPNLDGEDEEPSTSSIAITPDGKKMFIMDNLEEGATDGYAIFIYDLTTAFDISTMDVTNRTIVNTTGLGDDLGFADGKKIIKFNNDGKKLFLFSHFTAQFHNLEIPYDVASISASTLIPDDGLNYKTAYNSGALEISALYGVTVNNDGTRMYLNDGHKNTTDITQVNLYKQYDPTSPTYAINQNTKADVRARFEGIVRSVKVNLGERVEKGQVLAVIESNESLQDYNVTAPINGVILERNTNIGDVANGDALFVIADLSDVWAKFHVFPRDAYYVQSGQRVSIHTLEGDKTAMGKIDMLFPTADELTQTQIAIIVLPNPERIWKPGMTIEGDVSIAVAEAQLAVKESALQKMEELGDVVFIKEGDSYIPRPVKTGRKSDGYVEIIRGLKAGEAYVSDGSFIVKSDILKATAAHSH